MDKKCCVCGSGAAEKYFSKDGFDIMKCAGCGHLFVGNAPADLSPFYAEGYFNGDLELDGYMDYEADKQACSHTFRSYLDLINKHAAAGSKKLFEIGCATGVFLDLARASGWDASGIDISGYAAEKAKEKNLEAYSGLVSDLPREEFTGKFDALAMFDVLEHLSDPNLELDFASRSLKPGGILIFASPISSSFWARVMGKKWHAYVPPQHLHFFSKTNAIRIAEAHGFEAIEIINLGKKFTLPYIFRMLNTWQGLRIWSVLADCSLKSKWLKKITIGINLHDTAVIIARKK